MPANLRATATAAFLWPFRALSISPQRLSALAARERVNQESWGIHGRSTAKRDDFELTSAGWMGRGGFCTRLCGQRSLAELNADLHRRGPTKQGERDPEESSYNGRRMPSLFAITDNGSGRVGSRPRASEISPDKLSWRSPGRAAPVASNYERVGSFRPAKPPVALPSRRPDRDPISGLCTLTYPTKKPPL
jgi:hypothetical protein